MGNIEKQLELIAADIIMVSIDDMPGLAALHDKFLEITKLIGDKSDKVFQAAEKCSELIEEIILNEVSDKEKAFTVISNSVSIMQSIIRDKRKPSEVKFPMELGLGNSETEKMESPKNSPPAQSKEDGQSRLGDNKPQNTNQPAEVSSKSEIPEESLVVNLDDADTSLLADFITEAREHCSTAEQMLMDIESGEDPEAAINSIFRSFHTIKGASGFLDLKPVLVVAHESETLLDMARKGTIKIENKRADIIFDSIDIIRKLLDNVEESMADNGSFDAREIIGDILERLRAAISGEELSTEIDPPPPKRLGEMLVESGDLSKDDVDDLLEKQKKSNNKGKLGEILVEEKKVPAKKIAKALRRQKAVKEMVKIDTGRLDKLLDTIGELVIAESMVGQNEQILALGSTNIARNISHLNKITRELQEMGMAMRLVPVRSTFQKLARAVRDLTKKSGKKIELVLNGEDTDVDRGIVEHIGDPLMHMVRNSADHGIEDPDERIKMGKPPVGKITISAYHKGGNIYFDIEDDGRGLDKERILAKARENGLIDPNKELTDNEIYKLILLPGFSTAKKITDISGRGVGMDVVQRNIEAMRGSLEIESKQGEGTKISMRLPLTLAIIDGMLVSVCDEEFIIPTLSVVESLRMTPDMVHSVNKKADIINLRGELLQLFHIDTLFNLSRTGNNDIQKTVVVVEDSQRKIGLVVDRLLGQRQTVIKSLGPMFSNLKWVSGGAILSNGNVGLIIDVGGIVDLAIRGGFSPDYPELKGTSNQFAV